MLILIDRTALKMVAAAASRKWINLVQYVDFPNVASVIVDSEEGRTWTALGETEMAALYTNMSGQPAPAYKEAIEQLRAYSTQWPNYPKSEAKLEQEAESIYAQEVADGLHDKTPEEAKRAELDNFQQIVKIAEAANPSLPADQRPAPSATKTASAPSSNERPRQGVTKLVWEIADQRLAAHGTIKDIKGFRKEVIDQASAQGVNNGTAATQFGKWKASKGL
jgi:hypothetical protein